MSGLEEVTSGEKSRVGSVEDERRLQCNPRNAFQLRALVRWYEGVMKSRIIAEMRKREWRIREKDAYHFTRLSHRV